MAKKTPMEIYFETFDYEELVRVCKARCIGVTGKDTAETLRNKLSPKTRLKK